MSKETIKVYSHDGANITIAEIPKEDIDNGRLVGKYFTDYDECKEDRDFTRKVEEILHSNPIYYRDRIDNLERKLNGKDNRVDSLSDKIDNIKKECKRGQDLLLDRIKEMDSERTVKIKKIVDSEYPAPFQIILSIIVGLILGIGLHYLVN